MSHVEGLSQITANIQKALETEINKMNSRVELAGDVLYDAVRAQASLTDHTYKDLARLGFPYSKRYEKNFGPHKDDTLVHIQSGLLYSNIEKVSDIGNVTSSVAVGVSESKVPYIEELAVTGAPRARPRPFIQRAFRETDVEAIMQGKGRK
jgi:hypothetical protein